MTFGEVLANAVALMLGDGKYEGEWRNIVHGAAFRMAWYAFELLTVAANCLSKNSQI